MNTAVINVRIHPQVKKQAQEVAADLGISLSTLISGFLKHLVRTKSVTFNASEEPGDYLLKILKESKEDIKAGRISPGFTNADDAIAWLDNPKRKYAHQVHQKIRQTKG